MDAQTHQRIFPTFGHDFAMQQAALFEFVDADVEVVFRFQRQAAENGVAVMAFRIDGIFTVAAMIIEAVADDVVMRRIRKVDTATSIEMLSLDFL
ncbi:Uncharacterised protein [Mycobacteroides abscessus subsp. massiliense]|nr:Uncharacterised protein [Mycobacteroides abscessus subsp. massiliense]